MEKYVLDASALIAFLLSETGSERVRSILEEKTISNICSAVNLCEVMTKLSDTGMSDLEIDTVCRALDLEIVPFEKISAQYAASLRFITKNAGLSLGDRACLGLALQLGAKAVTADKAWESLKTVLLIELEVIR